MLLPNSIWKHHSGRYYRVLFMTNVGSTRPDYPLTVVYQEANDKRWTRPMHDWHKSFTLTELTWLPHQTPEFIWTTKQELRGSVQQLTTGNYIYILFFDGVEKMFKVIYIEKNTHKTGHKLWSNEDQAKHWVEQVHMPAKQ